jgi:hypothetical protein
MKAIALVVLVAGILIPLRVAGAGGRIIEPSSTPVKIQYDAQGQPKQFTIKVGGFHPGDLVAVEQCDGRPVTDPRWGITLDCDTATVPAQQNADAHGVATFPAYDKNFGFQPIRGTSLQHFFNCLGPGDKDPHNGLPTYSVCQVRVATSYLQRTSDEVFFPMDFGGSHDAKAKTGGHTAAIVGLVALVVLIVGGLLFTVRRRTPHAA